MASRGSVDIRAGVSDSTGFDYQFVFVTKTYVQAAPGRAMFTWFEHDALTPGIIPNQAALISITFANKHNFAEGDFEIKVNGVSTFTWQVRDARTACENFLAASSPLIVPVGAQLLMNGIDPLTPGKQRAEDVTIVLYFTLLIDFPLGYTFEPTLL